MEVDLQSTETDVPAGEPPTPPRRCLPFIILSSTSSASSTLYVIRSPFPPFRGWPCASNVYNTSWAQDIQTAPSPPTTVTSLVTNTQGYQLHHPNPIRPRWPLGTILTSPTVPTSPQTNEPVPPITEPLPPPQTTIPASPSGDQPIQNWELTPEPVPVISKQSLGPSHQSPMARNHWVEPNIPEHKSLDLGRQQGRGPSWSDRVRHRHRGTLWGGVCQWNLWREPPLHPASYRSNPSPEATSKSPSDDASWCHPSIQSSKYDPTTRCITPCRLLWLI